MTPRATRKWKAPKGPQLSHRELLKRLEKVEARAGLRRQKVWIFLPPNSGVEPTTSTPDIQPGDLVIQLEPL